MRYLLAAIFIVLACGVVYPQSVSDVWIADNGDGTYRNPIIHADYSDPDVIRVGEDFYMTASSFNVAPGLPILHSKDLVNWRIINHVFREQEPRDVLPQAAARRRRLGTGDPSPKRRILHLLRGPGLWHLHDKDEGPWW